MTEKDIFEHLFKIAPQSHDTDGVVTSCLVRNQEIVADAVSGGVEHAEYVLIKKLGDENIEVLPEDVLYVTLQPCDHRSPGSEEALGDCTTNVTNAGIKHVVYAAAYPKSINSLTRFIDEGITARQCEDVEIVIQACKLFNDTNENTAKHIPVPSVE